MSSSLDLADARRIALRAQGLAEPRPARPTVRHFRRVLDRLATVQLDSVNVVTRSHELVFFARLGAYSREALSRWLWGSGEVFEYWGHQASLHPVDRQPLFRWRMARGHDWGGVRRIGAERPELVDQVAAEVLARGPLAAGELAARGEGTRRTGWWGWDEAKRAVEHLFWAGRIAATRRAGFERLYLAPDRLLPAAVLEAPTPSEEEAHRALLGIAARAHGIGTARDLADYYRLPIGPARRLLEAMVGDGELARVTVFGWREPAYLDPAAQVGPVRARALLSPFDSLIWERRRTERLFDFHYRIGIYTPAEERTHGYYVLPFVLDERLVARVDLKADRPAGTLRVRSAHAEPDVDRERVAAELAVELAAMAAWLELDTIGIERRGDLARVLREAARSGHTSRRLE